MSQSHFLEKIFNKTIERWVILFNKGYTGSGGSYNYLEAIPGGTYYIIVSKSGYLPAIQKLLFPGDWDSTYAVFYLNPI